MNKNVSVFLMTVLALLPASYLAAATLQQFSIANSLSNQDATGGVAGQSPTSVLIKFFTSGANTPCYTTTLAYQAFTNVSTGTGQSCTAAVTSITFTPVASTTVGTIYNTPSAFTPTVGQFSTQITIAQKLATSNPTTSYGPVFDTTNGLVTTPGTVVINAQ